MCHNKRQQFGPWRPKTWNLRMTVKPSLSSLHSANSNSEASESCSESSHSSSTAKNYQPIKAQRPKPVNQWTVQDVQKWLRKTCSEYYSSYSIKFLEQDITGEKGFDLEKSRKNINTAGGRWDQLSWKSMCRRAKNCSLFLWTSERSESVNSLLWSNFRSIVFQ